MSDLPETMACFLVRKAGKDRVEAGVKQRPLIELPAGDVLIRVEYSSLNYKDALAAEGHPGVVRRFPHVPGIDAAGRVVSSSAENLKAGQRVIVTSYGLGSERWGGWAEYIRVPAEWVVPLPPQLTPAEAMIYGTAGFTAAQCLLALEEHQVPPDQGEIVVTGATGGVGSFAVRFLARQGYRVAAVTGKADRHEWLKSLGAARVIDRTEVDDASGKPLLPARWAGAVDTAGGNMLGTLLRSTERAGCVAACGLVAGTDLPVTVYPFILRGVTLAGIDSALCPMPRRQNIWNRLATDWKPDDLEGLARRVALEELQPQIQSMRQGRHSGRTLVVLS